MHYYQMLAFGATVTEPTTEAQGATNASEPTEGVLSYRDMRVRCRESVLWWE